MSLRQDLKAMIFQVPSEECVVPQDLMKRVRLHLVNSPRDDEETDYLLEKFSSREEPAAVEKQALKHMIDYLRGETE